MEKIRKSLRLDSRSLMFGASSVWVALILVISVFRGGGAVPVPIEDRPPEPSIEVLTARAGSLSAFGDYEGAWALYHRALLEAPEDVSLWYALGVTLSRLNHRTETSEAFQYVVHRGDPHSQEVQLARQWLVQAGVLAPHVRFGAPSAAGDATEGGTTVQGKVTWGEPRPDGPAPKALILLEGLKGAAKGKRFEAEVTLEESYQFTNLPEGFYHLTGGLGGHRLWDLTLTVGAGEQVTLDLSREISSNPSVALSS